MDSFNFIVQRLSANVLGDLQCVSGGNMLKGNDADDNDNEDEDDNDYDNDEDDDDEDDGSQSQCLYRSLVRHELTSHPPTL